MYFPLFVDIGNKKFLVVGAGKIAARRISSLVRYGASVTVIAPKIHGDILKLKERYAGQIRIEQRPYQAGEVQCGDADYVLAATDDGKANAAVFAECRRKGIPVNNASDSSQCDFYFPALAEKDNLVIGVASRDGNHKKVAEFARRLRQQSDKQGS